MHTNNVSYVTVHSLIKFHSLIKLHFFQQHASQCTGTPIMAVLSCRARNTTNCIPEPANLEFGDLGILRTSCSTWEIHLFSAEVRKAGLEAYRMASLWKTAPKTAVCRQKIYIPRTAPPHFCSEE